MKVDIYAHFVPQKFYDAIYQHTGRPEPVVEANPCIIDLDYRFRIMDKYPDIVQVLVPTGPSLEVVAEPKKAAELAKVANDSMAELVAKYHDRFVGAVAQVAISDMEAALEEVDRAIKQLKLKGVYLSTPQYGLNTRTGGSPARDTRPLDIPDLMPLYEKMAEYDLPIWIHPKTSDIFPDYTTEDVSKYRIWQIFGWPYHTTAAMTRLVFSGVFDKYPGIKFITHHAGAMVPFFEQRISVQYDYDEMWSGKKYKEMAKEPIDYFRMFYGDTALNGNTAALMCAYSFFGSEHLLFGTDMPHDNQMGELSVTDTIASIEQMDIRDAEKKAIFGGNARKLLRLPI